MHRMLLLGGLALAFCLLTALKPASDHEPKLVASDAVGIWLSENKNEKVEIYERNGRYYGKIIWMREPNNPDGTPKTDLKNPDVSKRNDPYVGLVILRDFEYRGNGIYKGGTVYDAGGGKVYKGLITLESKTIAKVRGYIGIPLLGKTEISTKVPR